MFDKLAGIILRNASEKTYAAMWEEEAADVEHMDDRAEGSLGRGSD